ncbi:MAG: DUF2235 domain-containing protein [Gemmataceae bacterium]
MARRIVLCLDGTDNSPTSVAKDNAGNSEPVRTNVSRLFRMLEKGNPDQIVYYQPGVGSIDPERSFSRWDRLRNFLGRFYDSMTGWMIFRHVTSAYQFLMDTYQEGDEISFFGFSRGSYVSRLLAGMIHKVGLLYPGHQEMIPFAWQVYTPFANFEQAGRFKKFYSRHVPIHFLGLWDTVSSVGVPWRHDVFPSTFKNPSVKTVRHAMAIDERRVMFQPNLWDDDVLPHQDVLQVWFPGVHTDVGGGYTGDSTPGLAGIPLGWMVREAKAAGITIDPAQEKRLLWPRNMAAPATITVQDLTNQLAADDQHDEIKAHFYWWLLEKIPLPYKRQNAANQWVRRIRMHLSRPRVLMPSTHQGNTIRIHHSADIRSQMRTDYRPENLAVAPGVQRIW